MATVKSCRFWISRSIGNPKSGYQNFNPDFLIECTKRNNNSSYFSFPSVKIIEAVKETGLQDWNVTVQGITKGSLLSSLVQQGWIDCPFGRDTFNTDCKLPSSSSTSGISKSNTDALGKKKTTVYHHATWYPPLGGYPFRKTTKKINTLLKCWCCQLLK